MLKLISCCAIMAGATWAQNLLCNGGFEVPQVTPPVANTEVPCWQTAGGQKIEVQRKSAGYALGTIGQQHVELDVASNSDIYQDFATEPGQRYAISFWFANRTGSPRSGLRVLWDGALLGTAIKDSTQTTFSRVGAEIVATKNVSRIGMAADGPSDGVGDLVDEVSVTPIPAAGSRLGYTYYLPHYAHGGGWSSSISMVNTSPPGYFVATVEKAVFGDDGTELEPRQTIQLNPGGSATIEAPLPAITKTGWVRLMSSEPLEASIIFRNIVPGRFDLEATVLARKATTETVAPYDNTNFVTGFAAANPGDGPITLTFAFRNATGTALGTSTLILGGHAHKSFALNDQFPQSAAKKGSVTISAADAAGNPANFLPLGIRFTPAGAFTTLPY